MTNLEKMKSMDEMDFAASVAAVTIAFRRTTKGFGEHMSDTVWGIMFAQWLRGFVNSPYDGAFDSPDDDVKKELDEMLKNMMRGDRRGNPFEGV